jgi:hypothetical protein
VCYSHTDRGFGFLRFLRTIDLPLWKTDTRQPDSPYASVFMHDSQLPPEVHPGRLPSRDIILEFELASAEGREAGLQAVDIQLVTPRR